MNLSKLGPPWHDWTEVNRYFDDSIRELTSTLNRSLDRGFDIFSLRRSIVRPQARNPIPQILISNSPPPL